MYIALYIYMYIRGYLLNDHHRALLYIIFRIYSDECNPLSYQYIKYHIPFFKSFYKYYSCSFVHIKKNYIINKIIYMYYYSYYIK